MDMTKEAVNVDSVAPQYIEKIPTSPLQQQPNNGNICSAGVEDEGEEYTNKCSPSVMLATGGLNTLGDISPPPRPMTCNDGLVLNDPDPDLQIGILPKKSLSLPASPNHLLRNLPVTIPAVTVNRSPSPSAVMGPPSGHFDCHSVGEVFPKLSMSPKQSTPQISNKNRLSQQQQQQQFCLRWNNYQTNLTNVFDELLQNESFVDVTLACEGQSIKAHKMVLSACSPYFQTLFNQNPCQHPIVIMRDVRWQELKSIMEFMYKGEINVSQEEINPLLKVAEMLKIRGLAEVNSGAGCSSAVETSVPSNRRMSFNDNNNFDNSHSAKQSQTMEENSAKLPSGLDVNIRLARKRLRDEEYEYWRNRADSSMNAMYTKISHSDQGKRKTPSPIIRNPFASSLPITSSTEVNSSQQQKSLSVVASGGLSASKSENAKTSGSPSPSSSSTVAATSSKISSVPTSNQQQNQQQQQSYRSMTTPPNISTTPASNDSSPLLSTSTSHLQQQHHPQLHHQQQQQHLHNSHQQQSLHPLSQHQLQAAAAAATHSHAVASALGASLASAASVSSGVNHADDLEIKPEIAEMIREEERAKMIEVGNPWLGGGGASTSSVADSYQYQLQSMWQKCWNTNQQNLVQQLRFRERGPLKSWRPEAMAEAIFSVLKEGLSLSQAARKYDIPYPTFVLYANRVHNMLGPSLDGGTDPRPKARGRPQRILLGMWPEELIRSVIKAVVFRDYREIKEEVVHHYANGGAHPPPYASCNSTMANGYNAVSKLASSAPTSHDASNSLTAVTENIRRQLQMQQQQQQQQPPQQQSPSAQSMNMYKSPAYLQRSEIEDQVSAANKQQSRIPPPTEGLPDLSTLGLIGIPGLNVIPSQSHHSQQQQQQHQRSGQLHNSASFSNRERSERELKEALHARTYGTSGAQARIPSLSGHKQQQQQPLPGAVSPFHNVNFKSKAQSDFAYNKRLLESLPPGIDFEAIANGLFQKSVVNKSPRFEDFFPASDVNELFASAETPGAAYPSVRESPLMKIKLEQTAMDGGQPED